MKTRAFLVVLLSLCTAELLAQLPPTIHRIAEHDTAVDGPSATDHSPQEILTQLFPRGGMELTIPEGCKPVKYGIPIADISRESVAQTVAGLDLQSVKLDDVRTGVFDHWREELAQLKLNIAGTNESNLHAPARGAAEQVYDRHALIQAGETHPAQVVLRRTFALLEALKQKSLDVNALQTDLEKCQKAILETSDTNRLDELFFAVVLIRRCAMFQYPQLDGIDRIAFCARACYAGSRLTNWFNSDRIGGHFATQVYGFNTIHGGGLFTISNWRAKEPVIQDLVKGRTISADSHEKRLVGRELNYGSFMSPELSYDGKTLYFSHCGSMEHCWRWTPDTTWNLFKMPVDGDALYQLTDSAYNDFDACELPSGRVVFISERRGGFIRCFGEDAELRVTTAVMHSMKNDGSDIYPLSFFETSEWQPSVDNNGMLVYTRWDYTDRENCLGSAFWTCFPDGRNPRAPHGNYPQPWHTFPDNKFDDTRFGGNKTAPSGLPMTELQIRAIPDSHKYVFLAAPHHGETFGSICILDLREKNDFHMSQIRRVTPYQLFPESESPARSQYRYGAPWPLDENVFLCNSWEDLVVLDRFGNEELICERELLPIGYDPRLRLSDPIPVRPRPVPPLIAQQTLQGEDYTADEQQELSTVGVVNVNISDQPLPPERPIKYLRVFQVIPKPNPWMNQPDIGFAPENTPRVPLGIAQVESDGSVLFEAPFGKQLLFQVLDENFQAVQTMRAVTYTHPGEKLLCTGCHEPQEESVQATQTLPEAFRKAPQKLQPECGITEPISFYRLIQPMVQESCVKCHQEKQLAEPLQKLDYEAFRPYVFYFAGGMRGATMTPNYGGSRSIPGRCGAGACPLSKILLDENHKDAVSDDVRHRFTIWMDANCPRLGAFHDEEAQKRGELVLPILDTEHTCPKAGL